MDSFFLAIKALNGQNANSYKKLSIYFDRMTYLVDLIIELKFFSERLKGLKTNLLTETLIQRCLPMVHPSWLKKLSKSLVLRWQHDLHYVQMLLL